MMCVHVTTILCDKFLQGKSVDDENKHINGEGQLVLAMLCSFVQAGGAHNIYGVLLSPSHVSQLYVIFL